MPTMAVGFVKPEIALGILHDCLRGSGKIVQGRHFLEELTNEGLTVPDAWIVLKSGCISRPPESDIRTGEWKYTIEGYTADGVYLAVVFSFKSVDRAYLITCFSIKARERVQ